MFCRKCGVQIAYGASFCHKCGTKIIYKGDTEKDTKSKKLEPCVPATDQKNTAPSYKPGIKLLLSWGTAVEKNLWSSSFCDYCRISRIQVNQ